VTKQCPAWAVYVMIALASAVLALGVVDYTQADSLDVSEQLRTVCGGGTEEECGEFIIRVRQHLESHP